MGILRIILALGVVLEHADYPIFAGSHTAVQIFFMISGFYMMLMYGRRYHSPTSFYASRALRLFPAYWVAALIYILYSIIGSSLGLVTVIDYWQNNFHFYKLYDWVILTVSNAFILGADLVWFTPKEHLAKIPHPVHLLIIPPIWTVSIEILFYMFCPLLMKLRSRTILYISIAILVARTIAYIGGANSPPWHARFAPFEMMFFFLGVLSARIYINYKDKIMTIYQKHKFIVWAGLAAYYVTIINFYFLEKHLPQISIYGVDSAFTSILLYIFTIVALPLIFTISKNWDFDRKIGDLSYPIYLMHYIFVILLHHNKVLLNLGIEQKAAVIVFLSLVHGFIIYNFIQKPIDIYRTKHFVKKTCDSNPV